MKKTIESGAPDRNLSLEHLSAPESGMYKKFISSVEKPLLENVLFRVKGNQLKAAKILGINRNTLRTKVKKLGINIHRLKDGTPPIF